MKVVVVAQICRTWRSDESSKMGTSEIENIRGTSFRPRPKSTPYAKKCYSLVPFATRSSATGNKAGIGKANY